MKKKILITGATGLIGGELVRQCHEQGIDVNYFTTSKEKIDKKPNYHGYYWDPKKSQIDIAAFQGITVIVNLVGASVSKRWTKKYKKTIMDSRIKTANLIFETLQNIDHSVEHFVSASGISIYPNSKTKLYTEEDKEIDNTFLAEVVVAWENAARQFKTIGIDVAKVRTGVVLDKNEGALPQIVSPIKLGVGAPLASGEQWQSWIHIADIAGIYLYIINNELEGIYNAVAPNPVKNKKLIKMVADHLDKPLWMPNIPKFMLHLLLGEMAIIATEGQLVSSNKIEELGYKFQFYNLDSALQDLL